MKHEAMATQQGLCLKWMHAGGSWFEHACPDSHIAGKLYNLRCQDEHVVKVELWHEGTRVLTWSKQFVAEIVGSMFITNNAHAAKLFCSVDAAEQYLTETAHIEMPWFAVYAVSIVLTKVEKCE